MCIRDRYQNQRIVEIFTYIYPHTCTSISSIRQKSSVSRSTIKSENLFKRMVLSRLSINCSKEKPSVPPDYASVSPDSTVLFSMPLKSSLSSSKTYSSVALPDVPRHASSSELAPSLVKLRSFKNKGTLLKHATSTVPDFIYNPFDLYQNPVQGTHSSNNLSISLQLDQDSVYLPGLFIEEKSSSTTPQYSNETNDTQEAAGKSSLSGSLVITVKSKNAVLTPVSYTHLDVYKRQVLVFP